METPREKPEAGEGEGESGRGRGRAAAGSLPRVAACVVDFVALQGAQGCSLAKVWQFMASKADLAPWAATRKAAVWRTLTSVPKKTLNITPEAKAKRGSPLPGDADAKRVTLVASECVRLQALRIPFPDVPGAGGLQMLEALASTLGKGMPTSEVTKKMSTAAVAAAAAGQDGAPAEGNKAKGNRMHYIFDGLEELMLVEKTVERNDGGSRNRLRHARFTSKAYLSDFKEESSAIKASEKLRGLARRVIRLLAAACSDLRVGHLAYGDVIFLLGIKSRTLWTFLEQEWKAGRSYVETRYASIRLMSSQDRTTHQDFFARVARRAKRNKAVTGERRILVLHKTPLIARAPGGGVGAGPVPSSSSSSSSKEDDDGAPGQEEEKDEGTRIAQRTLGMSQAGAVHGMSVTQQIFESAVAAGESGISITEMVDLMGMEFRSLARSLHRVVGGPSKKNGPSKKIGPSKKKPRSLPLKMAQSRALGKYNAVALISAGESELEKYGKSLLARERDSRVEKLKAAGYLRDVESIQRTDRQAFRMRVIFNAINAMGAVSMRRLMYEIHEQEDGMFDGVCDIESVRRLVGRCKGAPGPEATPELCTLEWRTDGDISQLQHLYGKDSSTTSSPPSSPPLPPAEEPTATEEKTAGSRPVASPTRQGSGGAKTESGKWQEVRKDKTIRVVEIVYRADRVPRPEVLQDAAQDRAKYVPRHAPAAAAQVVRIPNLSYLAQYVREMGIGETGEEVFARLDAAAQKALEERTPTMMPGSGSSKRRRRKTQSRNKVMNRPSRPGALDPRVLAAQARLRSGNFSRFKAEDVPLAVLNITNFPEGGDSDKDLLMGLLQASKLEHGDATRVLNYFFDVRLMVRARLLHGELLKYCRNKYGGKAPVEAPIDMRTAFEAMPVVLYLRIVKRPIASAGHGPTWTAETCEKAVEAALRGVTIKEAGRPELLECWPAGALRVLRELSLVRKEEAGREDQSSTWSLSMSGALKKNEYDFQSNTDVDAYWWSLRRHAAKTTSEDEMWHAVNWALFASMAMYRPPGASAKSTKASGKRKRAMGQRKGGRKKSRAGANSVALRPIGSAGLLEGPFGAAHKRRRERVEPWPPDLTRTAFEAYISSLDMGDVTRTVLKEEPSATSTELAQKKLRAALEGTPERVDVYKIASANIPSNDQHGRVWALRNLVVLHLVQLARQDHTRASAAPFEALCAPLQNVSRDLLTTVLEEFMACGFLHGLPANPTPKWPQYFASAINREAFRKLLKRVGADMQRPRRIQPSAFEFERPPRAEVAAGKSTREILDGDVKGVDLMRILPMLALGEAQLALDYKDAGTASTELPPLVESERSRRAPRVPVSELRNTEEAFAVALEHRRKPPSNGQDQGEGEGEGKDQPLGLARDEAATERPAEQKTLLQMIAQAGEDGVTNDQVGSFAQDLPALLRRGEVVRVPAFHQDRFVHRSHMGLWMFGHGNAAAVHHPWMSLEGCVDDYFKRSLARALVVHVLDYPGTSRKALFAAFYPILDLVHLNILLDPLLRGPDALLEVHIEEGLEFFSPSLRALDRRFLQPPA